MKMRFTVQEITYALREAESGVSVMEICRKMGISDATCYHWRKKCGTMGVSELRRLKAREEENRQLKKLVADLSFDKHMLQNVLSKKFQGLQESERLSGSYRQPIRSASGNRAG